MKKEELRKLLSLNDNINILKVETEVNNEGEVKLVYINSNKTKAKCPECGTFSRNIHDTLKSSKMLYLDNSGTKTKLIATKRRFNCKVCKKHFTEDLGLTTKNSNITLKVKQKVLKDCLDKDRSLKRIAEDNHIAENKGNSYKYRYL